jgi:hypothetical protein
MWLLHELIKRGIEMKKLKTLVAILIFTTVFFTGYMNFDIDGYKGRLALNKEINAMIANHDIEKMRKVTNTDYDYKYLVGLPNSIRCENTSDAQGSNETYSGYGTLLHGHQVSVTMKRTKQFIFGPKYNVEKIEIS